MIKEKELSCRSKMRLNISEHYSVLWYGAHVIIIIITAILTTEMHSNARNNL